MGVEPIGLLFRSYPNHNASKSDVRSKFENLRELQSSNVGGKAKAVLQQGTKENV